MTDSDPISPTRAPEVLRLTAFAAEPGGGNPAGVVLDARGLDDAALQAIAAEVGYSETAFLVDPVVDGDERHVRARYFSPTAEVPFCGHATIATAVALAERRGPGTVTVETTVGPIVIETTAEGTGSGIRMLATFTSVAPDVRVPDEGVAEELLGLLGLTAADLDPRFPLREAFAGNWHPVVAVASRGVFDAFGFDPVALRALMQRRGWHGTVTVVHVAGAPAAGAEASADPVIAADPAAPSELELEARNLFPVGEITEDPATGSAAASLGGYLRQLGAITPPARLIIHQGSHVGHPSLLVATVPPTGGIRVTGGATPIA